MKEKKKTISKTNMVKKYNVDSIKKALCKKALGFSIDEITEEYGADDGDKLKLIKRKVVSKQIPPDISALKILFEYEEKETDLSKLTDEELLKEKERLLKMIEEEVKDYDSEES